MGRHMKDGRYVNVNIDRAAFEALERHCRESGQTKTVAVERALLKCYGPGSDVPGRRAGNGGRHDGRHAETGG